MIKDLVSLLTLVALTGCVSGFTTLVECTEAYASVVTNFNSCNVTLNDLREDYDDLEDDYSVCEDNLHDYTVNITILQASYDLCINDFTNCRIDRETYKVQATERESRVNDLSSMNSMLTDKSNLYESMVNSMREECRNQSNQMQGEIDAVRTQYFIADAGLQSLEGKHARLQTEYNLLNKSYQASCHESFYAEYAKRWDKLDGVEKACIENILKQDEVYFLMQGGRTSQSIVALCQTDTQGAYDIIKHLVELKFLDAVPTNTIDISENIQGASKEILLLANHRFFPKNINYGCIIRFRADDERLGEKEMDTTVYTSFAWIIVGVIIRYGGGIVERLQGVRV